MNYHQKDHDKLQKQYDELFSNNKNLPNVIVINEQSKKSEEALFPPYEHVDLHGLNTVRRRFDNEYFRLEC